jgi:osmoprotectant transport system substrate-binding protein
VNRRVLAAASCLCLVAVFMAGCASSTGSPNSTATTPNATENQTKGPITVGSKIDTEGKLLGEMIVLMLEGNGFKVNNKTEFGTTEVVRKALLNGEVDIYPEYTGSGLIFFKNQDPATYKNPETGYQTDKKLDLEQNKVVWLAPAKANNTWALVVKKDFAQQNNLKTMSDLAAYVKAGKPVKIAASDEFFNNADAWPAFTKTYGFDIPAAKRVVLAGGNTSQTEKAVADGTNGVNVGMAYGTDGGLGELGLVVLTDDKGAQVVYWPTAIIREDVATKYPEIAKLLDPVFSSLTLEKLQELNGRIQVNGEAGQAVAKDYLTKNGFLK